MPLIIDFAILILFITVTLFHYKIGFLKSLYNNNLVSFILSTFLTKFTQPFVLNLLISTPVYNKIYSYFKEVLSIDKIAQSTQQNAMESLNLPLLMRDFILSGKFSLSESMDFSRLENEIISLITNTCINILSFILTFVFVFIILKIVFSICNFTVNLPVINSINRLMGALIGFFKILFITWFISIIITFLVINPKYSFIEDVINKTYLASIIYKNNYLLIFILKYFNSLV